MGTMGSRRVSARGLHVGRVPPRGGVLRPAGPGQPTYSGDERMAASARSGKTFSGNLQPSLRGRVREC